MISEKQARKYCYQDISLIENYEEAVNDTEHKWVCHHRVETIMNCGKKELTSVGAYYKRPAHDLIFLRHDEHLILHHKGKHRSDETRRKISEAMTGRTAWNKGKSPWNSGKRNVYSEETRRKMSEVRKRYWEKWRAGK